MTTYREPLDASQHEAHGRHGHHASLQDGLDFVNELGAASESTATDMGTLESALRWLHAHELMHQEMVDQLLVRHADDEAGRARLLGRIWRLRRALRELLDATVSGRPPAGSALREVNRALRTPYVYELVPAPDGVSLDHRHEGDPLDGALARLTEAIARELSTAESGRLRVCANDSCRWVFHDASPSGRRKWCDMRVCGNRAKVARHRQRRRQQATADQ